MNTKQNAPKKAAGFYVGICAALLCIVSAILYWMNFSSIEYKEPIFDSKVCILLCAAGIISIIMLLINKLAPFAPVVLCAGSGIAFLMYVHMIIWPVSDTIYGIEPFKHMNELILCAVLMLLSFVVSEVSLYLKKIKVPKAA